MAGAVPQARGGSNTSTIVMVVSIVVAVILLGVLIWLITMQEQLRSTAEAAKADKVRIQKAADESNKNVQALARTLSGSDKDSPSTAIKKIQDTLDKVAADEKAADKEQFVMSLGAATVVDNLYKMYSDERTGRETAESERDKTVKDLKAAQEKMAEQQKTFGDDLAALGKRVDDLQLAKAEFEKLKSADIETLKTQITAKQDALQTTRLQATEMGNLFKAEIKQREKLLDEQKLALSNLRGPAAETAQDLAIARKPVGTVLRALPGDSLVHIDLGKEDNVVLGMTFTVYSADQRVPIDGRGKAAVEVVSLGQRTAECRVMSPPPPDNPILEGDRVGNIIVSRQKNKTQRFCIVGGFDVDFDGTVDAQGGTTIAALVRRWGGTIVDTVDANTDYLIVGTEPAEAAPPKPVAKPAPAAKKAPAPAEEGAADVGEEKTEAKEEGGDEEKPAEETAKAESKPAELPKLERAAETDLTAEPRARRTATERDRYEEAVHRAEKLSIPRLPAERFYNFIGVDSGPSAARVLAQ